jgi:class 3 adenylate cyclase/streptogramin lyase
MPRGEVPRKRLLATVLFTDIVGSTQLAEELGDKRWRALLTTHHRLVRRALRRHRGREVDTAGDGFFSTFDQPSDAIDCAVELLGQLAAAGIHIRAGVHMGEVEVMDDKLGGIAVHVGARVMAEAQADQLLVSSTVRDLMSGSEVDFEDTGFHELKGVSATLQLFAVRPELTDASVGPDALAFPAEEAPRARRLPWIVAGAGLLVAIGVVGVVVLTRSDGGFSPAPNSVVRLDPQSGEVVGGAAVGTTPTRMAFGDGALWVANFDDRTIQRVNVADATASPAQGGISATPSAIAVGGGYVWVTAEFAGQVIRVDPGHANAAKPIDVATGIQGIAYGEDAVWIAGANDGTLYRLDPVTGQTQPIPLPDGSQPQDVAVGGGSVWVTDALGGRVFRVDASTEEITDTIPLLGGQPARIAFGAGYVWVTSTDADALTRIDPATGQPASVQDVGDGPLGVAAGPGGVWVANSLDGTITHIDPASNRILDRIRVGFSPDGVAVTPDGVWVSLHTL